MNRSKIRITYNPYEKKISYKRNELDKWVDLGNKSELVLNEKKYVYTTIQNSADDIIRELVNEYNKGNVGLDIIFEGAKEDFDDFNNALDFFKNCDAESDISLEKGDMYYKSPKDVLPVIENSYNSLDAIFKKYERDAESNNVGKIINEYHDAVNSIIPICVVGTYSVGKSAFINALIGAEILPSACEATTARCYKITPSRENGKITFLNSDEKIIIELDNDKYKINGNIDNDLRDLLYSPPNKSTDNKIETNMFHLLTILNNYANEKNSISDLIEVEAPFYNSQLIDKGFDFVIFDTPGSDAYSHKDHLNVLKNALSKQSNGLPIILTTPDSMDKNGMKILTELMDEIKGKLDLSNSLIVINRADQISIESLDKIKSDSNSFITSWQYNRQFYLSAIMGIASKKSNTEDWLDGDYDDVFESHKPQFTRKTSKNYKQLYKYNAVDKNKLDQYAKSIDTVDSNTNESELLLINSGLDFIEKEILEFAQKYASYNKCSQAQIYLNKAIEYIDSKITIEKEEQEKTKEDIKSRLDDTKTKLLDSLKESIEKYSAAFVGTYSNEISQNEKDVKSKIFKENEIKKLVDDKWKEVKTNCKKLKVKGKKVSIFLVNANREFERISVEARNAIQDFSCSYWKSCEKEIKDRCCEIINNNSDISDKDRVFLQQYFMNLNVDFKLNINTIESQSEIQKHFLTFPRNNIRKGHTKKMYVKNYDDYITNVTQSIKEAHLAEFNRWKDDLENGVISNISKLNPELKAYTKLLDEINNKINLMTDQKNTIVHEKKAIHEMFMLTKRSD